MKGEMPLKMHKIIFFQQKKLIKNKKMCATLSQIFKSITQNTLFFFIYPK